MSKPERDRCHCTCAIVETKYLFTRKRSIAEVLCIIRVPERTAKEIHVSHPTSTLRHHTPINHGTGRQPCVSSRSVCARDHSSRGSCLAPETASCPCFEHERYPFASLNSHFTPVLSDLKLSHSFWITTQNHLMNFCWQVLNASQTRLKTDSPCTCAGLPRPTCPQSVANDALL